MIVSLSDSFWKGAAPQALPECIPISHTCIQCAISLSSDKNDFDNNDISTISTNHLYAPWAIVSSI